MMAIIQNRSIAEHSLQGTSMPDNRICTIVDTGLCMIYRRRNQLWIFIAAAAVLMKLIETNPLESSEHASRCALCATASKTERIDAKITHKYIFKQDVYLDPVVDLRANKSFISANWKCSKCAH